MDRVFPTLRQIRESHSWKREYEKYLPVSRFFFRPIGFPVTWLFIRLGLTSEGVSWLSAVVGLLGCLSLAIGEARWVLTGIVFLFVFNLLDCVDGSIARSMKTQNPYGRFLDSVCGSIVDLLFWFAVGIALSRTPELVSRPDAFGCGPLLWIFLGALTGFLYLYHGYLERTFDELLRKYWEKPQQTAGSSPSGLEPAPVSPPYSGLTGLFRIVSTNLRVRETQYVLILLAFFLKKMDWLLLLYFAFYLAQNILLLITYSRRGRSIQMNFREW